MAQPLLVWPSLAVQTIKRCLRCGFFRSLLPAGSCALSLVPDHVPTKLVFRCFSSSGRFGHGKTDFALKLNDLFVQFLRNSLRGHPPHRFHPIRNDSPTFFQPLSAQISLFLLVQASKQHSDRQLLLLSCGVSLWATKLLLTCSRAPHEPNSRLTGTVLRRRKGKITPRKKNGESAAGGGHFFRHVVTFNRNTLER